MFFFFLPDTLEAGMVMPGRILVFFWFNVWFYVRFCGLGLCAFVVFGLNFWV